MAAIQPISSDADRCLGPRCWPRPRAPTCVALSSPGAAATETMPASASGSSSPSSPAGAVKAPWATAHDWDAHRGAITQLYWVEDKPLGVVREAMRHRYGFNATERMYKTRFRLWGLAKYQKNPEPAPLKPAAERQLAGQSRGGPGIGAAPPTPHPAWRTASPLQHSMTPPEQASLPGSVLRAVHDYVLSRHESGVWDPSGRSYMLDAYEDTWDARMCQVRSMLSHGHTKEAFSLLDVCLRQYVTNMRTEQPLLLVESLRCVLMLSSDRRDVGDCVLRYLAGLCSIKLGPRHPFSRFWAGLEHMGLEGMQPGHGAIMQAMLNMFAPCFKPGAQYLMYETVTTTHYLGSQGYLPLPQMKADLLESIEKRESSGGPGLDDDVVWARCMLASGYKNRESWVEARDILAAVSERAYSPGISFYTLYNYHTILATVTHHLEPPEMANAAYQRLLRYCFDTHGPDHKSTMLALSNFKWHLAEANDVDTLQKLESEFNLEAHWKVACEKADQ